MRSKNRKPSRASSPLARAAFESLEDRRLFTTAVDAPFLGTPFTPNQTILAVNYDKGGEGISYHDTTTANLGGDNYRPGDAVDIEKGGSTGNVIGYVASGEWLNYTVSIPTAGTFTLAASVANTSGGGTFHGAVAGKNLTGTMTVPATAGWQTYTTVTSAPFSLAAGTQVLRINLDKAGPDGAIGNLDSFKLIPMSSASQVETPYLATPFTVNQTIPAVDYDKGGQGVAFNYPLTTNPGGDNIRPDAVGIQKGGTSGAVIAYSKAGEWLKYTLTVPAAGAYKLQASVANVQSGGSFHANFGGANLTSSIAVPNTGGWATYMMLTSASFTLPAGQTVMQVFLDKAAANSAVANFDWLKLIPASTSVQPPLVWTTLHSAPQGLVEAKSATANGKLYVFGGYNVTNPNYLPTAASEVFDPVKNTWTKLAPMPVAETHMGVISDGTYIYVAGGYTIKPGTAFQIFGTTNVFRYNIAANSWSTFVPLPAAIGAGTLVLVGTELNFFDGVNPSRIGQTEHWTLDLTSASPKWINATPPPFSRNHMVAVVLDNKIYAMGGQPGDDDSQTTADALEWDPANPSVWTILPNMPIARSHAVSAVVDGKIMILGGTTKNDVPISSVVSYDPISNKWSTQTSLPSPRLAAVGGVLGNQLIITTGFGPDGRETTTWSANI